MINLQDLSLEQKKQLIKLLEADILNSESKNIIDTKINVTYCPYCKSYHIIKNGKGHGIQSYLCKDCHKSFIQKTNTVIFSTKKPLNMWFEYIEMMKDKLPLRKIANKLHINLKTAFLWRHKILKGGITRSKSHNLGHIDSFHHTLKDLVNHTFLGVATKYINNYVAYGKLIKQDMNVFDELLKIKSCLRIADMETLKAF